jgi:hypothetical protein
MQHGAEMIFVVKYLCKLKPIFETALAHESVDPGVLFDEKKTRGQKSCENVPLNHEAKCLITGT